MTFRKTTFATLLAIAFAGSFAGSAHSQDGNADDNGAYVALGGIMYNTELYGVEGKAGYNFNQYFGVEVQGSFAVNTDGDRLYNDPASATRSTKIDKAWALSELPVYQSQKSSTFSRAPGFTIPKPARALTTRS